MSDKRSKGFDPDVDYEKACEDWQFVRVYDFDFIREQFEEYVNDPSDGIASLAKRGLLMLDALFNLFSISRPTHGESKGTYYLRLDPILSRLSRLETNFREAMGVTGPRVYEVSSDSEDY